jgi:hypothetical protein
METWKEAAGVSAASALSRDAAAINIAGLMASTMPELFFAPIAAAKLPIAGGLQP